MICPLALPQTGELRRQRGLDGFVKQGYLTSAHNSVV